jgi:hypothetical protein
MRTVDTYAVAEMGVAQDLCGVGDGERGATASGGGGVELLESCDSCRRASWLAMRKVFGGGVLCRGIFFLVG